MTRRTQFLVAAIAAIAILASGFILFQAYMEAVMAGKAVREGMARVVEVSGLNCEEAKRDVVEEHHRNWLCSPDERIFRVYLRIEQFKTLSADNNASLLAIERKSESKGIWRCRQKPYFFKDVPNVSVGDVETFSFQFFPAIIGGGGSPLIFLPTCKR